MRDSAISKTLLDLRLPLALMEQRKKKDDCSEVIILSCNQEFSNKCNLPKRLNVELKLQDVLSYLDDIGLFEEDPILKLFQTIAEAKKSGYQYCFFQKHIFFIIHIQKDIYGLILIHGQPAWRAETSSLLRIFLDSLQSMVFIKNGQLRYLACNKPYCDFVGKDEKEIIGLSDSEILPPELIEQCKKTDIAAMETCERVVSYEYLGEKVFETKKFPVPIPGGGQGVGGIIQDITEAQKDKDYHDKLQERQGAQIDILTKVFPSVQEKLDYALHKMILMTESKYGYIYLYDAKKEEFRLNSWSREVMPDCEVVKNQSICQLKNTGFWGEVVRQRKAIIDNDFQKDNPLKKGYPPGHVEVKTFMSFPIMTKDKIVGVVGFANKERGYTDHDLMEMSILMQGIWFSVERDQAIEREEKVLTRLESMFAGHHAIMMLVDPNSGEIRDVNPAAISFYGYSKDELLNMTIQQINTLPNSEVAELRQKAVNLQQHHFTLSHKLKNGEIRKVDVYSCPIMDNGQKLLYSIIFDVTEREKAFEQIRYMSYHDYLTGLYNRRYFEESFDRISKGRYFPIGVIFGDINGLKLINDSMGYAEGDRILIECGQKISECLRGEDIVARVGGDEFAILLPSTNQEWVSALIRRIKERIAESSNSEKIKTAGVLSVSFGYAIQSSPEDNLDSLTAHAEAYMQSRKYYDSHSMKSKTVEIALNTLFEKSPREKLHSERVAIISSEIATKMGMSEEKVNMIRVAGLLHDIGKIGIPEQVLNKVDKLDDREWVIMKQHAEKGYRIIKNSIEYTEIADVILCHHERWDGKGYPNKMQGKDIPMASRIIAVADAFDAMTNNRTYQKQQSIPDAIAELKRCRGTQFDEKIVDAFVLELEKDLEI